MKATKGIKPATPLPWEIHAFHQWRYEDAAYIVHAANNYGRLVEALRRNHLENVQTAKELGGCDHSVGICQCDMNRMNEETGALLLEIGESA